MATSARASARRAAAAAPLAASNRTRAAPQCNGLNSFLQKAGQAGAAAAASLLVASSASALTFKEQQALTYLQIKGTGLANTCPVIEDGSSDIKLKSKDYELTKFCLEPTSFTVKEDDKFIKTKLMTRLTYTLDEISGRFKVGGGGSVELIEEDGIDYAATTVQLPGGERVPFLFSVKDLQAKGDLGQFGGDFSVPSYRGSTFLDPKGRGGSTGYDAAQALPAADQDELESENIKSTAVLKGSIVFSTARVNEETGEIAGVFESIQPSDTDLGSKAPKDIKITGLWYGQLS